ncbi:MAG: MerR family transcriptional regulator [Terasakiella sp.]|uniref:MerR family transcriptional regulator n=1 Tax=unclassified Terasakiella TaxID=2614952 RepID=UPI003B00C0DC
MTKSNDAFRTISEVAKELGLATHVLRFWESKFPQIKPLKRAGGRRYYRPDDVALLRRLQTLLHDEGYTIKGVQKLMREEGARSFINEGSVTVSEEDTETAEPQTPPQEGERTTVSVQLRAQVAPAVQQASLFDSPSENMGQIPDEQEAEQNLEAISEDEIEESTGGASYFQPLATHDYEELNDLPEPEPILAPDAPEPQIIVKRALSPTQRSKLEDVLSELKALKDKIESAA